MGTRPTRPGPHFAHVSCRPLNTRACRTTGSSRDPSGRSTGRRLVPAGGRSRRDRTGVARSIHLEEAEVLAVLRAHAVPGLAACDAQRLAAVRPEHVTDRLLRRVLERREEALPLRLRPVPRELRAAVSRLRAGRGQRVTCDTELQRGLLLEAWVGEEPAMLLEEPDHRGRPLHRGHVAGELGAEIGARAGLSRGGRENENEGAQTRYQGFQGTTSASETGQRPAPQSGSTRRARRGRLCQIRRGYRRAQSLPRSLTKPSQGLLQAFSRRTT